MQAKNRELEAAVALRNSVITQLERRENALKTELGTAKLHLADSAAEMTRLDLQTQALMSQVAQLNDDIEHVQRSYVHVRGERDELMEKVLGLEQERQTLVKKLSSIAELRVAIREAVEARQREKDAALLAEGNRGYVTRDGEPTLGKSTVFIKVGDPQATY
jgi:chromosome segregation ATPase